MDLLQGVKDMEEDKIVETLGENVAEMPNEMPPMPSTEELLKMLEGMTGMSEEDKADLKAQILGGAGGTKGYGTQEVNPASSQMMLLFCLLLIIALIFVFFGYKLYKSLVEKERRRDEKKKLKQMKKKK